MSLSARLEQVCAFVPSGAYPADVGSDHGEVPIALWRSGKCPKVFAIENKPGPFATLSKAIAGAEAEEGCLLSLSDGIEAIPPEVDTLILAGMGGHLIIKILQKHPEKLKNIAFLVVDAHTDQAFVREQIAALGYRIAKEQFLLEGGIAYDVMGWEKSAERVVYAPEALLLGPLNILHPNDAWRAYYGARKAFLEDLLAKKVGNKDGIQSEIALLSKGLGE